MLKLYNTASKKLEEFKPLSDVVKVYTCGPTVYSEAHIGNLTAFIYWDLLVRIMKANDYKVKRVLNLTDVGHLTSDADSGEDKLEKGALKEGLTVWEVADKYIAKFMDDYHALSLLEGNWRWEGPLSTPLGLVHWKRASSPVEAGTSGFL